MTEGMKRNTAYHVWIANLLSSKYTAGSEQFESGYIEIKGNKVSRVNIIGTIIDKFSGENYLSLSCDDGSGVISLKSWGEDINSFSEIEIGDIVLVIGKIKEYNNTVYITSEILKKLNNILWLKHRKLELTKEYGSVARVENIIKPPISDAQMNVVEEKMESGFGNRREILLSLIETLDFGSGADIYEVVMKSGLGDEGHEIIKELIKDGEVFNLQAGKVRVMN